MQFNYSNFVSRNFRKLCRSTDTNLKKYKTLKNDNYCIYIYPVLPVVILKQKFPSLLLDQHIEKKEIKVETGCKIA